MFLPIWLRYYTRFFAPNEIYVIDGEPGPSTAASPLEASFVRIAAAHDGLDNLWMVGEVQALQHRLLACCDVVVVCDVDEIIAP